MPKRKKAPELTFQDHIADFLIREHGYGVLEQTDITDTEHFIAEDQLWAFLEATQTDILKKLADDYGADARDEVFRALRKALEHTPLWLLLRHGLKVRGLEFRLYYPKPRSADSAATGKYGQNRITFRPHLYFGETHQEIDFVFFLNGLPIVALEVKHEKNQNVHDAVAQFARRDHTRKIFQHPFLYLAADTSDVMAATDPRREPNFRWHNTGLTNTPQTAGEYPVEFLYREVLSREHLLEALSFFLVRVPQREAEDDKPERPAFTLFPRYHQSRTVRKVADDISVQFAAQADIGRKYLIHHSAGSGKTLTICWLADRLHSLFKPGASEKLVDQVFILTDRKSLDTNIKDDIENFTHLKDVVGLARQAADLPRFLAERKPIIVTTQQKFAWVLDEIETNPELKKLRVAFLIDEAHRSQEGQMAAAIRLPFRNTDEPDADAPEPDPEEQIAKVIREHDRNQLFVAFTATPAPATVTLFGEPFDTYSEAEAIAEGYIVDVAASIISYKTLYNLHCPIVPKLDEEKLYPKGVVSKALQNVAFQDDGLIQYKSEVMLRIFEKNVMPLIGGRAKAMIVATSRVAGLRYFQIIKEKLKERGADYKVLYAFSDFVHPATNAPISEHAVNELKDGELIEERFEGDDYRLMIVANKFQTGFDQPLLAGMFLDKPVVDRNAVQTVSRLNRCHEGKNDVVVVDFTNNAKTILNAFAKYRKGTPFEPEEPDQALCLKLHYDILAAGVFTQKDAADLVRLAGQGHGCPGAILGQRAADPLSGETHRPGGAQGIRLPARPLRAELPLPDLLLHLCAGDRGVRHVRRIRRPAAHQRGQRVRIDAADSPDRGQQGRRGISGRGPQWRHGEAQTGQRQERLRPAAQEGVRPGHDRGDSRQVRHQRRGSPLHQAGHRGKSRRPGHPKHRHRAPGRPHLSRRPLPRAGQRPDSDGLRRARTLRGINRSQIQRHRRHLRPHGVHRDRTPSGAGGLRR